MATQSKSVGRADNTKAAKPADSLPWHIIAVKTVSLPGYGSIFSAWISLLGMFTLGLYTTILDTGVSPDQKNNAVEAQISAGGLFVAAVFSILFWVLIAHLSGLAIRWIIHRFKIGAENILALKLALVAGGWFLFTLLLAILVPEQDYLAYIFGGFMIALGGISFAAEEILLKLWRLKPTDSW